MACPFVIDEIKRSPYKDAPVRGDRRTKDREAELGKAWVAVVEREVLPFDHTDLSKDVTS